MHFTIFLLLFAFNCIQCKNHVKKLTESMGQEIIEMGAIKDLPPGLEEEPSAESDDEENSTTTTLLVTTKRDTRRTSAVPLTTQSKAEDVTNKEVLSSEEEEIRIEKELAEIYKDTDYKSEPNKEVLKKPLASEKENEKPIARSKTNFKFQPDTDDRADVERFRTSIDEISCERRVTQRLNEETSGTAMELPTKTIIMALAFLAAFVCE